MSDKFRLFAQLQAMTNLPVLRQLGLLAGFAVSIALGIYIVLWSQTPQYRLLYSQMSDRDAADVVDALERAGIPYTIQESSGSLMVPEKYLNQARLDLAKSGLPKSGNSGMELLENAGPFGNSELMETTRYQHILEGELAQTIQSIRSVRSARVHLAIPKQSAFLHSNQYPTASVMINLFEDHRLDNSQVTAIRNLVAASVANLDKDNVSIIDENGELLTQNSTKMEYGLNTDQFEYTHKLEEIYKDRIVSLLTPIIGPGGVRAQVVLDIDYSITEQAQELYDPQSVVVRSEQIDEEKNSKDNQTSAGSGVPGVASNLPSSDGNNANIANATDASQTDVKNNEVKSNQKTTRNYEIGKTLSHTRLAPGKIQKLSAAVVLDDKQVVNDKGVIERVSLTDDEITRITTLVKETVGFNEARGDTIHVNNSKFISAPEQDPLPPPSLIEQPWVWSIGKMVLGVIGVLILIFGVLKPVMRSLAVVSIPNLRRLESPSVAGEVLSNTSALPRQNQSGSYEHDIETVKAIVSKDPRSVAQVVKNWVASDA